MTRKKLRGRKPRQPSIKRGRHQVNFLLTPELKDQLLAAATKSGRTISGEAAALVETALTVKGLLTTIVGHASEGSRRGRE